MTKPERKKPPSPARRPEDWSPEERLRAVVETAQLSEEELTLFSCTVKPSATAARAPYSLERCSADRAACLKRCETGDGLGCYEAALVASGCTNRAAGMLHGAGSPPSPAIEACTTRTFKASCAARDAWGCSIVARRGRYWARCAEVPHLEARSRRCTLAPCAPSSCGQPC